MMRNVLIFSFIIAALLTRGSAQVIQLYCAASNVVTPGHAIDVTCTNGWWNTRSNDDIRIELAPLTSDDALDFMRGKTMTQAVRASQAVDSASATLKEKSQIDVKLNPRGPGAYVVRIFDRDELVYTYLSTVSRFGILTMTAGDKVIYAPIDLANDSLYAGNVTMRLRSPGGERPLIRSIDGAFVANSEATAGDEVLDAAGEDGSVSFLSRYVGYWYRHPSRRIYGQTDRPIYHAGDRVSIRAIVRTGYVGDYRIDHSPLTVNVTEGYPVRAIAKRTLTPDAFGAVATTIALPEDAELGNYEVSVAAKPGDASAPQQQIARFNVEAYKKPEYTLDVAPTIPYTIGGDDAVYNAKFVYLSGASAANITLHYEARTGYWWYPWYGPFSYYRRPGHDGQQYSGDVTTDGNGVAVIRVPTTATDVDGNVTLTVEARDESGRTVSTNVQSPVVPGSFRFDVEPERWVAEVRSSATIAVSTLKNDATIWPDQPFHVAIVEENWDKKKGEYVEHDRGTLDLHSDSTGKAKFSYTPSEPGVYRINLSAKDERGHAIAASQYQWVVDPESNWAPYITQPQLVSAKTQFDAGEPLEATLVLLHPSHQAVVAIATDHLVDHRIVDVHGLSAQIKIPAPKDAQFVSMTACVPDETGVTCATTNMKVASSTELTVRAQPLRTSYRPGERARFKLHVEDVHGKPVRAQLSLGVVDEGIFALAPEAQSIDPSTTFYVVGTGIWGTGNWFRPNANPSTLKAIAKVTSAAANSAFQPTQTTDTYSVSGQGSENGVPAGLDRVALRKNFLDTAYWAPSIVTDAAGDATAEFTWPENLTTWRASTVAATAQTQFGTQTVDVMVTKPLMARLEMPRFLRAGDTANITGIVHGPKTGLHVAMQFDPSFLASRQPPVSLVLDGAKHASASWPVTSRYVGSVNLALRAIGGSDSDGMQLTLPLLGATPLEHDRSAGEVENTASVPIDLGPSELASDLHISFAPSMIAQLAQTVRQFDVYPYYCTEQTSSNGIVAAALLLAGANKESLSLTNDPKAVIAKARDRLANLRHADNAWGWWNQDQTSLFMTAYALYAQNVMDRATFVQNDWVVKTTATALVSMLESDSSSAPRSEVALGVYALSQTPEPFPDEVLSGLIKDMDRNDALTIALTGLAAKNTGRDGDAEVAAQLLIRRGDTANGATFWHDLDWDWRWWSDPVEATALSALLLHETGHEPEAQRALAFIRAQRNADWWYTTLDTAMASMAIAEIEGPHGAGDPDETATVLIDGRVVKTVHITSATPDSADTHVVIPASIMHNAHAVSIERSGSGNLYWDSDFEKYGAENATETRGAPNGVLAKLFAKPPVLSVKREYSVGHEGPWRVGDVVTVKLWISAAGGAEYVTLEDPFPAGTEYQLPQGESGSAWRWDGAQFLDDRAAFFLRKLWPGQTEELSYILRATTVGTFAAPGPSAFASYGPPVSTIGTGERVAIEP